MKFFYEVLWSSLEYIESYSVLIESYIHRYKNGNNWKILFISNMLIFMNVSYIMGIYIIQQIFHIKYKV